MYKLYCIGAFTDAGGHALNGAKPDVTGRKDSWDARFEQPRFAFERPAFRRLAIFHQISTGENKSLVVAFNDSFQPFGSRSRADEDEERSRAHFLGFAAGGAVDRNCFQPIAAENFGDTAVHFDVNV